MDIFWGSDAQRTRETLKITQKEVPGILEAEVHCQQWMGDCGAPSTCYLSICKGFVSYSYVSLPTIKHYFMAFDVVGITVLSLKADAFSTFLRQFQ
ncbi:hypothetical protein RJ641_005000 [Dillenia turbinata]|uniref:Uncharacterized protein n=1 Tax=Dillenia turbinata TaxID=194707 RepID=A0AAN8V742_9MAGN